MIEKKKKYQDEVKMSERRRNIQFGVDTIGMVYETKDTNEQQRNEGKWESWSVSMVTYFESAEFTGKTPCCQHVGNRSWNSHSRI